MHLIDNKFIIIGFLNNAFFSYYSSWTCKIVLCDDVRMPCPILWRKNFFNLRKTVAYLQYLLSSLLLSNMFFFSSRKLGYTGFLQQQLREGIKKLDLSSNKYLNPCHPLQGIKKKMSLNLNISFESALKPRVWIKWNTPSDRGHISCYKYFFTPSLSRS